MRFLQKTSVVAAAGLALSVLGSAPATAASNWNSNPPTSATEVSTRIQISSAFGTLQLRKGKWNGKWWVWARITNPTSTANKSYVLAFVAGGTATDVDINGTSYTKAYRLISGKTYKSCIKKAVIGGGYDKCTSFTG
ncbi:hypothetical protein [Nonomuraea candida]|uniref:hypothetical protein n=1 Tax=Nonomuraea candida TaxID=359159 RepID=UPI0005B9748D|nr:hypothetical protein [Nonomuraea candida]